MTTEKSDATTMGVDGLLEAAARLVEKAILQLNVRETVCAACGGRHFENRTDAKAYERLTNTPEKLRATVALLKTGKEPDGQQVVDTTAEMLGLRKRTRP